MDYDANNIFAKILRKEIPSQLVYEDDAVLAIKDVAPKAPIHILVLPKGPYTSWVDFSTRAPVDEIAHFFQTISKIADLSGLSDPGFRLIANTGINGGQEVPHFHVHLLGGKQLGALVRD